MSWYRRRVLRRPLTRQQLFCLILLSHSYASSRIRLRRLAADCGAEVDEFAAELAEALPDPVDLFEGDLARKLGLERGPVLTPSEYRRMRFFHRGRWGPDSAAIV